MMLMACDQSVRGFAVACAPTFWAGDWSKVATARFDGGLVSRGDEAGLQRRFLQVYRWVDLLLCDHNPTVVGFESYGFGSGADLNVVELVGAIKLRCMQMSIEIETVQQGTARKLVAGRQKVPRKGLDAKLLMAKILQEHGSPWGITLDESDALVILNSMLITHGGRPLVTPDA